MTYKGTKEDKKIFLDTLRDALKSGSMTKQQALKKYPGLKIRGV